MDVKQLHYFATIAEEGQITRAAKKLYMAQPPLSQQLKLLEQELGVSLFERQGRELKLTEAGQVLYNRSKEILYKVNDTVTEVTETGEGLRGVLSIGSVKTCFCYIPDRMKQFQNEYPNVSFKLIEGDSFRLAQYLNDRDIELAIVRKPLDMSEFSYQPLPNDNFVAVVSDEWGLSGQDTISMKEMEDLPLMLLHRAGVGELGLYELVLDHFEQHNIQPNVICECADAAMLLSLVKAGVGATLLPQSTLKAFPAYGLKVLELEDTMIQSESALIWLKDRHLSKHASRFIETFQQEPISNQ